VAVGGGKYLVDRWLGGGVEKGLGFESRWDFLGGWPSGIVVG
jgi:hypothetical protein